MSQRFGFVHLSARTPAGKTRPGRPPVGSSDTSGLSCASAGAVSLGEALTVHRPDMLQGTNTLDSRTIVASLLDWANAALKNKISRESSMPDLDEKGGTQRQQILKAGTISFDGSGIDCLVRKMSGTGANLEVESQIGIPNSFDLVIDTEHSNHHCHVVWRKARRIGIAFD